MKRLVVAFVIMSALLVPNTSWAREFSDPGHSVVVTCNKQFIHDQTHLPLHRSLVCKW